jgi:membrane-bound acyltransferase YfiQ involved in biofilm formation
MLRRVALVRTDVSKELSAYIIRTTRIAELGTVAVTSNRRTLRRNTILVTLMMEALHSSETSVLTRTTGLTFQKTAIFRVYVALNNICADTFV